MAAPGVRPGRPVGDFVPGQAAGTEQLIGGQVPVGHGLVIGHRQLTPLDPGGEPGALLDDERVRGDVIRARRQGRFQRLPPVLVGLPRGAVDEVQADVLEACLPGPPGAAGRQAWLVHPVQHRQHVRDRALHAKGDPGDPRLPERRQRALVHAFRVGLHGHLHPGASPNSLLMTCSSAPSWAGASRVGVPPPKNTVVTGGLAGPSTRRASRISAAARSGVGLPGHRRAELGGGVGVEVAVAAPGLAERHMHVDTRPSRLGRQRRRRAGPGECAIGRHRRAARRASGHGSCAAPPAREHARRELVACPGRGPRRAAAAAPRRRRRKDAVIDSATVTRSSGRDMTSIGSPAATAPSREHPQVGAWQAGAGEPLDPAAARPASPRTRRTGYAGQVTWTAAVPSCQVSPISAAETSRPAVVMFSPNRPLPSSRPSCSTQQSRSSRA